MTFEEVSPHLNKLSTLYLKNQKRKVGVLMPGRTGVMTQSPDAEVYFLNVRDGKKVMKWKQEERGEDQLKSHLTSITLEEIVRIRSQK